MQVIATFNGVSSVLSHGSGVAEVASAFGLPAHLVRLESRGGGLEVLLRLRGGSATEAGDPSSGFTGPMGGAGRGGGGAPMYGVVPGGVRGGAGAGGGVPGAVPGAVPAASPGARSASLWVGDLNPDVDETVLYEVFNAVSSVSSIRLCRNAVTRQSLGYAYINFESPREAERVLDAMNYAPINGRPCRIMWSERDPSRRRSNVGNIFVKGLALDITSKELHDIFSTLGNIVSCHVAWDSATNKSRGYGYVQYDSEESARAAVEEMNGVEVEGSVITVEPFRPKTDRKSKWNNLYVKHFPRSWSEEQLRELFSKYGEIVSVAMPSDSESGKARGFAFVCFSTPEEAQAAVDALHETLCPGMEEELRAEGKLVDKAELEAEAGEGEAGEGVVSSKEGAASGKITEAPKLYVQPHQKSEERVRALRARAEQMRAERQMQLHGLNLYVRNLDESVDEDALREAFAPFGKVTSVRVSRNEAGRSRLFGYVCFSSQEEATRAQQAMNSKMLAGKPLYVALWQPRSTRQAQIDAQTRSREMRRALQAQGGYGAGFAAGMDPAAILAMQQAAVAAGGGGRGAFNPAAMLSMNPAMGSMVAAGLIPAPGAGGRGGPGVPGGRGRGGVPMGTAPYMYAAVGRGGGGGPMPGAGRGGMPLSGGAPPGGATGGAPKPGEAGGAAVHGGGGGGVPPAVAPARLDASRLAAMPEEQRRQIIGERLYDQISHIDPERAAKITGMLLEGFADVAELLELLESPEALREHAIEAAQVLDNHVSTGAPPA